MAKNLKLDINMVGAETLSRALTSSDLVGEPLKSLFSAFTVVGLEAAQGAIDGGTGLAIRTLITSIKPTQARVLTMMHKTTANRIERGRTKSGPMPSVQALVKWQDAVGNTQNTYALLKHIRRKGTKGKRYMKAAQIAVTAAMPELKEDFVKAIEAYWRAHT